MSLTRGAGWLSFLLVLAASARETAEAGAFLYEVVPYTLTDFSSGASFSLRGTMTTDCSDCTLAGQAPTGLLNFDITVSGPSGYTFTYSLAGGNSGANAIFGPVRVSPTEISMSSNSALFLDSASLTQQLSWTLFGLSGAGVVYSASDQGVSATFSDPLATSFVVATAVSPPDCDFDSNLSCDIADLNAMLLLGPIAPGISVTIGVNEQFDLTGDGIIDLADQSEWLSLAAAENGWGSPYKLGDANLDGAVDGSDFSEWNANKFTAALRWDFGNFNGDSLIDGSDFSLWNTSKFSSSSAAGMVPEPFATTVGWYAMACVASYRRSHRGRQS